MTRTSQRTARTEGAAVSAESGSGASEVGTEEATHPVARLPEQWQVVLQRMGERAYRAGQVFRWIHRRGVMHSAQMTDLGRSLRERLSAELDGGPVQLLDVRRSRDHTRKLLLGLSDGARVECVLIPVHPESSSDANDSDAGDDEEDFEPRRSDGGQQRVTLCVSTQHGCKMGCVFCASGRAGFSRHLDPAEIVGQVLEAKRQLQPGEELHNVVFMGMGEPLDAYPQTVRALRLLTHPDGMAMSPRRITVSTVGLPAGIVRLGRDFSGKVGLAVSLHAPDDATRSRLVPVNRRHPLREVIQAMREYPLPPRRRITIEYTLIEGVNDALWQARALAEIVDGLRVKVNLIGMNPIAGSPYRAPAPGHVARFQQILADASLSCFVRTRRGDDVDAACGQLAMGRLAGDG